MISDETRSKVEKVREMYQQGIDIQGTGETTNAVVTGMLKALLDHIDELEADLKAAIALGKAYANHPTVHPTAVTLPSDMSISWHDGGQHSEPHPVAIDVMVRALDKIACHHVTEQPLWWQMEARQALAALESKC